MVARNEIVDYETDHGTFPCLVIEVDDEGTYSGYVFDTSGTPRYVVVVPEPEPEPTPEPAKLTESELRAQLAAYEPAETPADPPVFTSTPIPADNGGNNA